MLDIPSAPPAGADYATVKRAIEFISTRWRDQPSIEAIAEPCRPFAPRISSIVFKRWAGLTPKAFLQAITIERARELLRDSATVLDAAYDVGLSGPSRLHDLFVTHEALTPGDYRRDDLTLAYGFHASPFGEAIVVAAPRGMAGLGFVDEGKREAALADMAPALAARAFRRGRARDRALCRPRLRSGPMAARRAAAHRPDRHGFRAAGLGDAAQRADGLRDDLFGHRAQDRQADGGARRRRRGRAKSDLVRRALSSRAGALGRAHRLPLGPRAQAGDHRLGGGASGGVRRSAVTSSAPACSPARISTGRPPAGRRIGDAQARLPHPAQDLEIDVASGPLRQARCRRRSR